MQCEYCSLVVCAEILIFFFNVKDFGAVPEHQTLDDKVTLRGQYGNKDG